jgi:hypothetical protein
MNDEQVRIWKEMVMACLKVHTQPSPVGTEENYEYHRTAGSATEIQTIYLLNTNLQHYCYVSLKYMFYEHVTLAMLRQVLMVPRALCYNSAVIILLPTGRSPSDGLYLSNSSITLECPLCEALNSAVAPSYKAHAGIHMLEYSSVSNIGIYI